MTCIKLVKICILLLFIPAFTFAQADSTITNISNQTDSLITGKALHGIASYYHDKFEGRKMANGRVFSQKKPTAACNILPLNKWVKVTCVRNNRSVIVKITDRMHPKNKRLIDLSLFAAKELKMVGHGLVKVKVEVLKNYIPPKSQ